MGKMMLAGAALVLTGTMAQADVPMEARSPGKLTITADLDFTTAWRSNIVDFSDDRKLARSGSTFTKHPGKTGTNGATADQTRLNDTASSTWVKLDLNFHADLGSDAYMAAKLRAADVNNRNWGAATNGSVPTGASVRGGTSEFEVELREAYAHLNNFLFDKLAFRLGVQEMNEGLNRGNGTNFLLASGDLGGRYQIRNGGTVDAAFNNPNFTGGASSDWLSIGTQANPGFGWKASYGMEQGDTSWNFDVLWTQLTETDIDQADYEVFGI